MVKGHKDYSKAKIYRLCSDIDKYFYIGSTCTTLVERFRRHKDEAKRERAKNRKVYEHFKLIGWDNVKIVLIEDNLNCENIDQLTRIEQEHIDKHKDDIYFLNSKRSWTGIDTTDHKSYCRQYLEQYHEEINAQRREHYRQNREEILAKMKQPREEPIKEESIYYAEWRDANPERLTYEKAYRENNKAKINEVIRCTVCDCNIYKRHMKVHERTQKHRLNLQETKSI